MIDEDPPEDEDDDGFIEQLINYTNPGYPEFIRWEGTDDDSDGKYAEDWVGGVDLNRNYDYAWEGGSTNPRSEIYKGPSPFSEPETQAIRDFVLEHDFTYAISFHSGVELILYPWGHTYNPPPDEVKFIEIAQGLSSVTGGTPYQQASYLYFTHGVWDDWMYGVANVSALTCEIFYNETWEGVAAPGPYSNTQWEGGLKYWFNPFPTGIETTILRWLPVFFYITNRAIDEVIHNVAINDVVLYETVVTEGSIVEFNASVQNKGSFQETFNVNAYYDAEIIETREISLSSGASENLSLTWDTTGMAKDNYTISVYASPVLDETEMGDNVFYSWVVITILGDINGDKTVNILDAIILARAFGTRPGHHGWNSSADLNRDRDVNILDAIILATHFGETWV